MLKNKLIQSGLILRNIKQYIPNEILGKKAEKLERINELTVVLDNGLEFQVDEESQNRIQRAIKFLHLTDENEIKWKMADNTIQLVSVGDLKKALIKAFAKQSEIWLDLKDE